MSEYIDNLAKDTYPPVMVEVFVKWCVWEQARPALVKILRQTGVDDLADAIQATHSYSELETLSEKAGQYAHEIGKHTGPLGISTAEASSFLMQKLARAAQEADWDPEGVSFFTIQILGWYGFAESHFTQMVKKIEATNEARTAQEEKLSALWQEYGSITEDD